MPDILLLAALFLVVLILPTPVHAQEPKGVTSLVLNQEWSVVFASFIAHDRLAKDPVCRMLMAHACLATNRNNESLRLLLATRGPQDLAKWRTWTQKLATSYRDNATALYLAGDAGLRAGQYEQGLAYLNQAIEKDPTHALALNARGIALAHQGSQDNLSKAEGDLRAAIRSAPMLADAHANLGVCYVLREPGVLLKEGSIPRGVRHFNDSLNLNPSFAMAYNGRGCALYNFGGENLEDAANDFFRAYSLLPELRVARLNEAHALVRAIKISMLTQALLQYRQQRLTYEQLLDRRQEDLQAAMESQRHMISRRPSASHGVDGHTALQMALGNRILSLERKMAVAYHDRMQVMKGLTFATKVHATLRMADFLMTIYGEAASVTKTVMDQVSMYCDPYLRDLLKDNSLEVVPVSPIEMVLDSFAKILGGPLDQPRALADKLFGEEMLQSLQRDIDRTNIQIARYAAEYADTHTLLLAAGVQILERRFEQTVTINGETWTLKAGSNMHQPSLTHQTRKDRPLWEIASLMDHITGVRTASGHQKVRVSQLGANLTIVLGNSLAASKQAVRQLATSGYPAAIMRRPTKARLLAMNTFLPRASVVNLSSSTKPIGPITPTDHRHIRIYISDFGVGQWKHGMKLGDDFSKAVSQLLVGTSSDQQILIPMDRDIDYVRLTEDQKAKEIERIRNILTQELRGRIARGTTTFEIQIIQDIKFLRNPINDGNTDKDYFDPEQQEMVAAFGEVAYEALARVHDDLELAGHTAYTSAHVGSNGAAVLVKCYQTWHRFINWLTLHDGRAKEADITEMLAFMTDKYGRKEGQSRFHFFNTHGDALGPHDSISNARCMERTDKYFPNINHYILSPVRDARFMVRDLILMCVHGPFIAAMERYFLDVGWTHISSMRPGYTFKTKDGQKILSDDILRLGDDIGRSIEDEYKLARQFSNGQVPMILENGIDVALAFGRGGATNPRTG